MVTYGNQQGGIIIPYLKSTENVLNILYALRNTRQQEVGLNELSRMTDINKGTIYKILPSLISRDLVVQNPISKKYALGVGLIQLAEKVYTNLNVYEISHPILLEFAKTINRTVTFGIKQADKLVFINRLNGNESANFYCEVGVGQSLPFYKGAAPKACFAQLDDIEINEMISDVYSKDPNEDVHIKRFIHEREQIKRQKIAVSDGEVDLGVLAMGTPIFNYENKAIGGIAVAGIREAFTKEELARINELLVKCGEEISYKLGATI